MLAETLTVQNFQSILNIANTHCVVGTIILTNVQKSCFLVDADRADVIGTCQSSMDFKLLVLIDTPGCDL